MLDMGFIRDISKITALLPKQRQTLMFSATFSTDIRNLAKTLVRNPVEISVNPRNTTVEKIEQWVCPVDKKRKPALLAKLINDNNWFQVLVFTRTKHGANRLARQLGDNGIDAVAIHGNKSQNQRTRALADFKQLKTQALVATDIAARGLDINQLPHVVNFDMPNVPEDYIHRIGRTGRAGAGGEAISLVSADEIDQLSDIESLIRRKLPREIIAGFEPVHEVPDTKTTPRQDIPRKRRSKRVKSKSNRPGSKMENRGSSQPGKESRSASPGNSKKKQGQKKRRWHTGKKQPTRARLAA
jgi:ATP-dependent RNA helicase RhlE